MPPSQAGTLLGALVNRDEPVAEDAWRGFWERLRRRRLDPGEALAVVCTLSSRTPEPASIQGLIASLQDRATAAGPPLPGSVNIVGTGGGPPTFNLSTAAAFVAATVGARVVKTGSRAYSSRCGSVDLLERLGIPLTRSPAETAQTAEAFGIAFAGSFVYPKELRLLGKSILPFDMRTVGRFFNTFGPFLATVPVTAQLTGVSNPALRSTFVALATATKASGRRFLIGSNPAGVDELVSFADNLLHDTALGRDVRVRPEALGLGPGSLEGLRPPARDADIVGHFTALLSGRGPRPAVESVALNAAALAVASGAIDDWHQAVRAAVAAMERGKPLHLLERMTRSGRAGVLR
jgi:anthranilate phosphoribosyltransferase